MIRMKLHLYSTCLFVILMLMLSIQTNAFSDYSTNLVYNGYIQDGFGDIDVGMYSVPVVHDWNNDGKKDILIGQNNGGNGYISYYENTGSNNSPLFNSPTYIEACNTVCQYLNVTAGGWQGSYPTVVDWDNNGMYDLLVGDAAGYVEIFLNTNTNSNPILDSGNRIQVAGADLKVGARGTPIVNDWNGDGRKDLLVGEFDGHINIYMNEGTDAAPVYNSSSYLQMGGADFDIGTRAAPRIYDWNNDGLGDLLVGEYEGYVYFLENTGTSLSASFDSAGKLLLIDGDPLQYSTSNPRSRLYVTDWNEDGLDDILLGGADGRVQLYTSVVPEPISSTLFLVGGAILGLRRFWRKKERLRIFNSPY